jgi:acetyltransferase-like isoleucine patch superfamily enzyme
MKLPEGLNRYLTVLYLRRKGVVWKGDLPRIDIFRRPIFMVHPEGKLVLGSGVEFLSDYRRTRLQVDAGAELIVGDNVLFFNTRIVRASSRITIGDHSAIGEQVTIRDRNNHEVYPGYSDTPRPVHLGIDCYIGEFSSILPGVTLGEHCFIGSHSKVFHDTYGVHTPGFMKLLGGNPAVVVSEKPVPPGWMRERYKKAT